MKVKGLTFVIFLGILSNVRAPGHVINNEFYVIANQPALSRKSGDLYLYAIDRNGLFSGEDIEFTKSDSGLPGSITETGEIRTFESFPWGCYLRVSRPNRFRGSRFGTYMATQFSSHRTINTFIRQKTRFLNTRGVFSVTVYPKEEGSTELAASDDNSIGVAWQPGCQKIRWCKGKQRNINTGPRLTLSSTKDAGIYTIQRRNRGSRGWITQIEVIVASCPKDEFLDGTKCVPRADSLICLFGGVGRDKSDVCTCPPFFLGSICQVPVRFILGVIIGPSPLYLRCEDLPGGNPKCKGHLFCAGELFGCKCFPGWFGDNCDKPCPKNRWGIECSQTCPESFKGDCDRFTVVGRTI